MTDSQPVDQDRSQRETAVYMAQQVCLGFREHDRHNREASIGAFVAVDVRQFTHVGPDDARSAATAYVDALWAKDAVEDSHTVGGDVHREELADADWAPVKEQFRRRAAAVGIDERYAELSTRAWRNHKTGGDYWTPLLQAQVYELRAALQDPAYPHKPDYGQSGYGPEAARYVLGVELHDMHTDRHWEQARDAMIPYYERILRAHGD